MPSLSEAAGSSAAAKRNRSEWMTVTDVTVPSWKPKVSGSKLGKLGQQKKG